MEVKMIYIKKREEVTMHTYICKIYSFLYCLKIAFKCETVLSNLFIKSISTVYVCVLSEMIHKCFHNIEKLPLFSASLWEY